MIPSRNSGSGSGSDDKSSGSSNGGLSGGEIAGIALCDLGSVFLGLDSKFTTNGVLGSDDSLVDVLRSQSHFGRISREE